MMTDAVTSNDLIEGFREVGLKPGDVVLAHSAMRTFGPIDGGADAVIDALREVTGPRGTVVVPTFTFAHEAEDDPMWRMPLWPAYEKLLDSKVADINNVSDGGAAGSITAALFLKQFVEAKSWTHLDVWAWRLGKYGRPEGAAACGLRAVWQMLQDRYSV